MQIFDFNHLKNNGKSLQKSTPQFGQHFAGGLTLNLYLKLSFAKRQRRQLSLEDNNCLDFRF